MLTGFSEQLFKQYKKLESFIGNKLWGMRHPAT
jgi:hypothetical protein